MRRRSVLLLAALGLAVACAAAGTAFASTTEPSTTLPISSHEHRLAESLASGGLPRDRAMHAWLARFHQEMGDAGAVVPGELRQAAADAPRDRLVQWLWANADDVVAGCSTASPCADRAMALAVLEPDNAAAWLPVLSAASRRGDAGRVDELLTHMAGASTFDALFVDSSEAWYAAEALVPWSPAELAASRADGGVSASAESLAIYAAIARAAAFPMPSLKPLLDACQADRDPRAAARHGDCVRIGRVLLGSGTMLPKSLGFSLLQRIGAATPTDADAARRARWLTIESMRVAPSMETDGDALRRYFSDLVATRDEYQAMERRILRGRGRVEPPVGWREGEPGLH
jgi:hypothetical protein